MLWSCLKYIGTIILGKKISKSTECIFHTTDDFNIADPCRDRTKGETNKAMNRTGPGNKMEHVPDATDLFS